jgi:hypothetical protein
MATLAATFLTALTFGALAATVACLVLPARLLPDCHRGGWGRYAR